MALATVLLVDDHEDAQIVYSLYLLHIGYEVVVASNFMEGLTFARLHKPEVVVLEMTLQSQLQGVTAAERLLADEAAKQIPIVAMSVHPDDLYRRRAAQAGCVAFIEKPCLPARLARTIEWVLGDGAGSNDPAVLQPDPEM